MFQSWFPGLQAHQRLGAAWKVKMWETDTPGSYNPEHTHAVYTRLRNHSCGTFCERTYTPAAPITSCMLSHFSHVQICATLWTIAHQAPLSMGFSRQEYWSGLQSPSPGDLPDPEIKPVTLTSPALAGRFFTISTTWEAAQPQSESIYATSKH